jgi:membrane protease YdiL (CAAX protease family)
MQSVERESSDAEAEERKPRSWQVLPLVGRLLGFASLAWTIALFMIAPMATQLVNLELGDKHKTILLTGLASNLALLVSAWVMARFADRRSFVSLGFDVRRSGLDGLTGVGLGVTWLALTLGGISLFGRISMQPVGNLGGESMAWAAGAILLNAIYQELLVHGYMFQVLERLHAAAAVLVTSTFFTFLHWGAFRGDWLAASNIFLAGTAMGLMYWRSRNLWSAMACHFTWNFLLGPALGLTVSGSNDLGLRWRPLQIEGPTWLVGGEFGLEGGVATTLATVILIAVIVRRRSTEPRVAPH